MSSTFTPCPIRALRSPCVTAMAVVTFFSAPGSAVAQAVPAAYIRDNTPASIAADGRDNVVNTANAAGGKADHVARDEVQKVTISGGQQSDLDVRRTSVAGKMIFGREELDRNGDSSIGEILKRLPSVTIGGKSGRGGDIRMRGMGSGYTQILINGERAPRGFSMDSLSPNQVERIEVIRGPVAEFSTQAIAGTINIVLREEYKQKEIELKIVDSLEQGRSAPSVSLTYPGHLGELSYAFNGSISRNRQHDESATHTTEKTEDRQLTLLQDLHEETSRNANALQLTPRLSYRFGSGDTLMLQTFIMNSRSESRTISELFQLPATTTQYASTNSTGNSENTFARGFANWQHKFSDNSKLSVKFGGGVGRMDSSGLRIAYDISGKQVDVISDLNNTRDSGYNTSGKYSVPVGERHTLAFGWDIEAGQRNQTRISLDNGVSQFADSGDNLDASTRRFAMFMQDEFDINAQWSAYAGLRWESIRTGSALTTGENTVVNNTSKVLSPILHGVWRIPESKDQIRMSLTSSYRAPTLNDLIALPSISTLNGPTRPDRTGNPSLKPELSSGIDVSYEHYLSRAGIVSANLFVRSINDLIRRNTALVTTSIGPRWVSAPVNIGHALTRGIELEAKFQLREFFPEGPAIDVRSNYSRYWSNVDDIAGSNNRLDQQPAQTANIGLDYRADNLPFTVGGNLNWTPAYQTQTSNTQSSSIGIKRQIDVYGLWKFSPNLQLRLSVNNVTAYDYLGGSVVTTGGLNHIDTTIAKTYTTLAIRLEMKI